MSSIKNLSAIQLSKMLNDAQAELERRENIKKARKNIEAVLKKYNITINDLDLHVSRRKPVAKKAVAKAPRKNNNRAAVAAKYHNPATGDKWSGRGRSPAWVTSLCASENIDVVQFKADPRFRI